MFLIYKKQMFGMEHLLFQHFLIMLLVMQKARSKECSSPPSISIRHIGAFISSITPVPYVLCSIRIPFLYWDISFLMSSFFSFTFGLRFALI